MLKSLKIQHFVYVFLLICVFSTNHIIIYNEEILVALSFYLFVFYVARSFGGQIKDSLESSSITIKDICDNVSKSKDQSLELLSKQFKKTIQSSSTYRGLKKEMQDMESKKALQTQSLWSPIHQQWLQKCSTLITSSHNLQPLLIDIMAANQLSRALCDFSKKQSAGLDKHQLKLAVTAINGSNKKG